MKKAISISLSAPLVGMLQSMARARKVSTSALVEKTLLTAPSITGDPEYQAVARQVAVHRSAKQMIVVNLSPRSILVLATPGLRMLTWKPGDHVARAHFGDASIAPLKIDIRDIQDLGTPDEVWIAAARTPQIAVARQVEVEARARFEVERNLAPFTAYPPTRSFDPVGDALRRFMRTQGALVYFDNKAVAELAPLDTTPSLKV
jgi:hypothetical protein